MPWEGRFLANYLFVGGGEELGGGGGVGGRGLFVKIMNKSVEADFFDAQLTELETVYILTRHSVDPLDKLYKLLRNLATGV